VTGQSFRLKFICHYAIIIHYGNQASIIQNMNREKEINALKKEYLSLIEKFTPEEIKKNPIFNLEKEEELEITLNKSLVEKLGLEEWLENYKKEAEISTGGIRGAQNVIYYWDTRFPINQIGIALATIGKALVLRDDIKGREIHKIASGEVRYNTQSYIDLISRIQANLGIHTHLPFGRKTVPVWMVSFLIFMLDRDGGEYVTSSHAISSKTATKDFDNQGSNFFPEMSLRFVAKIEEMLKQAKENPEGFTIKLAPRNNKLITEDFNGYDMYADYLKKNVAKDVNIKLIKEATAAGFKLMYETVGGCMYNSMVPILDKLGILAPFDWRNKEEDPFFHGVGKVWKENPKIGKKEFFDLSCDFCLMDVTKSANFEKDLKDKPIGYVVLMSDPDGDRLAVGQVEPTDRIKKIEEMGAGYIKIDEKKIFVVYHPSYAFLLIMDYYMKQLKEEEVWPNHPRFIITTAPSPKFWDEWAGNNGIKVITTPVGIKEISYAIRKVEKQIFANPEKDVIIEDIFSNEINLGKDPRMVFGGEESGGMIIGLENPVESKGGRKAISMREKTAGEASIIATALAAYLFKNKKLISEHLEDIFKENKIKSIYFLRDDIIYYNESEQDPKKMFQEKAAGEVKRDKTDGFYLSLILALRDGKTNIETIRDILKEAMPELNFSRLQDIKFAGDSVFFQFENSFFVQIRRSGTDAKMRGYSGGYKKEDCRFYLDKMLHYDGEIKNLYEKNIPSDYLRNIYATVREIYKKYLYKNL